MMSLTQQSNACRYHGIIRQTYGIWAAIAVALVGLLGASSSSTAGEAPARYMQRVAKDLLTAARSSSQTEFARTVRSHADYPTIGLYSLGAYAKGLPQSDRNTYYSGMINFIARYAATNSPKYPVSNAVVTGQTEESTWKVRDAQVLGFWMSPFLKDLFEKYIAENGGNPRALVVALNR